MDKTEKPVAQKEETPRDYLKAVLGAFGPLEAVQFDDDTWLKIHQAISLVLDPLPVDNNAGDEHEVCESMLQMSRNNADFLREQSNAKDAELERLRKALEYMRDYPKEGHGRRTDDGYPHEFVYDEFAYRRMVNSFREACMQALQPPTKASS